MNIEIGTLRKADEKKAIPFAIQGMHFDWYLDSRLLLSLYGRYFWYMELTRATQILAAYIDGELAGVLLAQVYGEDRQRPSFWRSLYVRLFDMLQKWFYKGGAGAYEKTNQEMFAAYRKNHTPDGEIIFLAANPACHRSGIGSALLAAFEHREPGKQIYLYTDDACAYPFYEHRGFERVCERKILLDLPNKQVPLRCFLYSKVIPQQV